jgi:hypothetical protein
VATHPPLFTEAGEPLEADHWLRVMESKFEFLHCTEVQKALFAALAEMFHLTLALLNAGTRYLSWRLGSSSTFYTLCKDTHLIIDSLTSVIEHHSFSDMRPGLDPMNSFPMI